MANEKQFLRRKGERKEKDKSVEQKPPRKILSNGEKIRIYNEYIKGDKAIKHLCNDNNISCSTLYSNIIPYVSKQNGVMENDKNVKILNLEKELEKIF